MNKFGRYNWMVDLDEVCSFYINDKTIVVDFKNGITQNIKFGDEVTKEEIIKIGQDMFKQIQNTKILIRGEV